MVLHCWQQGLAEDDACFLGIVCRLWSVNQKPDSVEFKKDGRVMRDFKNSFSDGGISKPLF